MKVAFFSAKSYDAPLTPKTRHIIDKDTLSRMKRGVMIINTGRGALVDTQAVIAGLKSGHIGFLGLDVYEEEEELFFDEFSQRHRDRASGVFH